MCELCIVCVCVKKKKGAENVTWRHGHVKRIKASRVFKVTKTGRHYSRVGKVSKQEVTP